MRADAAGAKTWLFGAFALWALVVWALGLFGLGGRIERLPEDPSLLQRLPQAAPAAAERLGPLPQYAEIGDRPLFSNDRRPQPFLINPEGDGIEEDSFDFVLTSVLLTPGLEMAIVHSAAGGEPVRLKVGEAPEASPAWRLAAVSPRSVVFSGPDGERTLEMRVFDGVGGEAPTAMTVPRPQAAPAAPNLLRPAPPAATPRPADGTIPVTTSSSPTPVPVPVPQPPAASQPDNTQTPDAQVEAIRKRIEARRAQLRQQAQQPPPPAETP